MLPFDLPSLTFTPLRYRNRGVGDWSGHIPFACDLIAGLLHGPRPSVFVELGTHLGESYFAFCQAIAESGSRMQAYAIDTWRGDVHTGNYGEEVFSEVAAHNREHYECFSHLLRMTFDEAASRFETGSIDLLHIDGTHTYEAVRHDFDTWWPKLKPGGILLLHDSIVRHSDFGVWKLMEELRRPFAAAEFLHSNGLGVILKPGPAPESEMLSLLFGADQAASDRVRRYYEICAGGLEEKFWSERRKHPADQDITTQLFWRAEGEPFTEAASVRLAHTVTAERSQILLTIPPLAAPPVQLRLLLTHSPAFLELHQVSARNASGELVSNLQAAHKVEELKRSGFKCVAAAGGTGALVLNAPAGASLLAPVPAASVQTPYSGGQIVVEMSGVDPLSFAAQIAKIPPRSKSNHNSERWVLPVFLAVLALLCLSHVIYFSKSPDLFTASREADYMRGAVTIANSLRAETFLSGWTAYHDALGFKAPLLCVPGGILLLFTKNPILPFCIQLILTFAALGIASYSLFRNCFGKLHAASAVVLLLCMPLVNGLTHNYYAELLVLLLAVLAMDLLIRFGWRSGGASFAFGIVAGLGVLTQFTFALFLILPVVFCWYLDVRKASARSRLKVSANVVATALIAFALAWPWYAANLPAVVTHARSSASNSYYYYPHWILADLSAGPSIFIAALALIGLLILVKHPFRINRSWGVLLLTGLSTAIALAIIVNKSVRFQVTWLPTFAALAVAAWYPLRRGKWFRVGPVASAFLALIFSLHNSFNIFPVGPVRFGDLQLLNSAYALNAPQCFDDNHPVDPRNYRLRETEGKIASDAAARFPKGYSAEARTTQSDLLFNSYYFDFLSAAHNHPVLYTTWPEHADINGPHAADYLVYTHGFGGFYPGTENFDFYPQIAEDAAQGRIPYRQLFELEGPEGSGITVLVRAPKEVAPQIRHSAHRPRKPPGE